MRLGWRSTVVPAMLAISMTPVFADSYSVRSVEEITDGIFPVWSPDGREIAFTRQEKDTFEIYFMKPDGSDQRCVTCNKEGLREAGFRGQPYYHPSGKYLAFVAESSKLRRKGNGVVERPGVGRNNNVWIMNREGTRFWPMTDYEENWGVIRPSFSHDGTMIYWNEEFSMEKYAAAKGRNAGGHDWGIFARKGEELGAWRIKWGKIDFDRDGAPRMSDVTTINPPEGFTLLEGSGFTPDDRRLIYAYADLSEAPGGRGYRSDIYLTDLRGGSLQRLTSTPTQHDENAVFSPDGKKIAWTHPVGTGRKGMPGIDVEIYMMNADGTGEARLTNFSDPKSEYYDKDSKQMSEVHWSPDGNRIVFGHASRARLRDPNMGASVWILTFEGAGDVIHPPGPASGVRPPAQPTEGPGGASYRHRGVHKEVHGEGPQQFWIYEPSDPAPKTAPVIVFGHGGGGVNPRFYGAWIEHLVRRGNIVLFPRYQNNVLSRPGTAKEAFVTSVKAAFDELKKSARVRPELDKVALVGHSWGAVLSANLAAMTGSAGLPRPRALMIVEPGIVGIPMEDLSKVPKDTLALVVVGEGDTQVGDKDAKRIYGGLTHIDPADRDYIIVRTDDHGEPPLLANHLAPDAVSEDYDSQPTKRRRARLEAKLEDSVNAIDYYGFWKLLDGLTDAAFYGKNRDYALGDTHNQRYMGTWSDGTPVKELVVTDTP